MNVMKLLVFTSLLALSACGAQDTTPDTTQSKSVQATSAQEAGKIELAKRAGAPLFAGMGDYNRKITTISPDAQKYFNQGMVLAFGFNHAESIRSFKAAQKLDPTCAMCYWGEALATGPNINVTSNGKAILSEKDALAAKAAIDKALELQSSSTPLEQALIQAQAQRYSSDPAADRAPLDTAYAQAMGKVVAEFPDDDDAAAIYAESWMNTMPWDYWSDNGTPKEDTVKVITTLENIIERTPNHPLALHLYIHATEASSDPGRAEDEADKLAGLVPASGHLVHMPAHIYWRVGRYEDAAQANILAAAVDEEYIAQCNAQGFYPALYYPHNIHFLWAAASMSGQSELAISSAFKVADNVHLEQIEAYPTIEFFKTIPLLSQVQFAKWDAILATPQPPENLDFSNAIWHYARGVALARTGQADKASAEQEAVAASKDSVQVNFLDSADYPASTLLNIADALLAGEIALAQNELDGAVSHFQNAVDLQDTLPYTEPPFWYYPTRQSLGAAQLLVGQFVDAEATYRADLAAMPRNGWSLHGLIEALKKQGRLEEAEAVQEKFDRAWSNADIDLTGSRL